MKLRHVYLALCVLGFLLPYSQLLPWLVAHGFSPSLFLEDLFANRIGGFFGLDVLVSAVVLCVLILTEGRRLGLRGLWLPIAATFVVGVSLGLPLFLYLQQVHLDRAEAEVA
jgi:Terpene cyclase DEP1